jgi:NADPH-ferrihemoprotein reductase
MLSDGFLYTVLGLGDSNLLLDRQTTGPTDCNQVAQNMDTCLHSLGGTRWYPLGLADERVGLDTDVEPWFDGLLTKLLNEVDSAGTM